MIDQLSEHNSDNDKPCMIRSSVGGYSVVRWSIQMNNNRGWGEVDKAYLKDQRRKTMGGNMEGR